MKFKKAESEKETRVDFDAYKNAKENRGRFVNVPVLNQLQDSLIARGYGEPQRLAILATSASEMDKNGAASKGIGGNGILGYNSTRMPVRYLDDSIKGRGNQIHYLLEDIESLHPNNWSDGGKGGPFIRNAKDAYEQFWNSDDVKQATVIFNKGNIRPAGGEDEWNARGNEASIMKKYSRQTGGIIYKPFVPENTIKKSENKSTENHTTINYDYPNFPIEPVRVYKPTSYAESIAKKNGLVVYKQKGIDIGNMQELIDIMVDEGIRFRITSGNRPGAKTKDGNPSHHGYGNALDITPVEGETWNDLISQMKESPRFITYMKEHGLGILDERSQEMLAKTGGTGAHFHIGPDKIAQTQFKYLIG